MATREGDNESDGGRDRDGDGGGEESRRQEKTEWIWLKESDEYFTWFKDWSMPTKYVDIDKKFCIIFIGKAIWY